MPHLITDSQSIRSILKYISFDSVLLLDLDNTVIESQLELGSDQWFVKLCRHAPRIMTEEKDHIAFVVALYHEIQKIVRAKAVEELTVKLIKTLQDIHIPIIAITARDACLKNATERQLKDSGIHFKPKKLPEKAINLAAVSESPILYDNGIIYCAGKDKGFCFKAFLKKFSHISFKHVVMVDDKLKHLQHVETVAKGSRIRFNGIRYGYLDDKVARFSIHEANLQLNFIKHRLPSNMQEQVQALNIIDSDDPDGKAHYPTFFYENTAKSFEATVSCTFRINLK